MTDEQRIQTACPLDCPDACSLVAQVRDGRLETLDGDHRNPVTDGFICAKVRRIGRAVYGKDRLTTPMLRVGDKGDGLFEPTDWDSALDLVARRLGETRDRFGGTSILPFSYGGSNGAVTEGVVDRRFFRRLGASELERTVCASATGAAHGGLYGSMVGVDYRDYEHADLIVVWGFNPSASGIHLVPVLKRAQARGAKLVVIDPRRTPMAKKADLHLPVRPGTDLALALGLVRWLFEHGHHDAAFLEAHTRGAQALRERAQAWTPEAVARETGLPRSKVLRFAELYRDATPAVIRCGWGLERNRNGGSAVAAVLALPAVAGKFGVRGGGFTMSNSKAFGLELESTINAPAPAVRSVNMNKLGLWLTSEIEPAPQPPISALFVYDCNPAATMPDQTRVRRGLMREDLFTVVFEQVMNDTCKYADVILPATTFLEHHEVARGYGAAVLNRIKPAIAPVGRSRANARVFAALIERMGLAREGDITEPTELAEAIIEHADLDDTNRATLAQRDSATLAPGVQFVDQFPNTADRRVDLFPAGLDEEARSVGSEGLYTYRPDPRTEDFPLTLLSPASHRTISSTFGQFLPAKASLLMHADDARARGITDGAEVRVFNALGEVRCRAATSSDLEPGVLELPKGLWERHTSNGYTSNALCPPTLTDLGQGATFNDARVQVTLL